MNAIFGLFSATCYYVPAIIDYTQSALGCHANGHVATLFITIFKILLNPKSGSENRFSP